MIEWLKLENVGPAPQMELEFAPRLNMFTGDNGLGKSFLLDVVWNTLTYSWPAQENSSLQVGLMPRPQKGAEAWIRYKHSGDWEKARKFEPKYQDWFGDSLRGKAPIPAIYAMIDGSYAVREPTREHVIPTSYEGVGDELHFFTTEPLAKLALTYTQAWNGLETKNGKTLCNGLIRDWASWQKEKGENFEQLMQVLKALSPPDQNPIRAGKLTRVSLDDVRDVPTIVMPYGQEVPVVYASSGMRRILSFAYLLVWTWQEHLFACELKGQEPAREIVLLIDEVEAHLHPRWQQTIMRSLLEVVKSLSDEVQVQLLVTTHAPLVMASLESLFDQERDAWFDLDFVPDGDPQVQLTKREFRPQGDASNWLKSEAFNLESSGNVEYGKLMQDASKALNHGDPSVEEIKKLYTALVQSLPPGDPFLFRWRAIAESKGLLKP